MTFGDDAPPSRVTSGPAVPKPKPPINPWWRGLLRSGLIAILMILGAYVTATYIYPASVKKYREFMANTDPNRPNRERDRAAAASQTKPTDKDRNLPAAQTVVPTTQPQTRNEPVRRQEFESYKRSQERRDNNQDRRLDTIQTRQNNLQEETRAASVTLRQSKPPAVKSRPTRRYITRYTRDIDGTRRRWMIQVP